MTPTIALMVLASAALHPLWNMLIKGDDDRAASWYLFTVLLAATSFVHCLVIGVDFRAITDILPMLLFSWSGQFLYGVCLIRIYERADLSAYYPIVRASPIGVVILSFAIFATVPAPAALAGIALTVGGAFWLQKRPGLRLLDDPKTLLLAIISMIGTAIYAMADARAAQHVPPPLLFFSVEIGMTFLYLPLLAMTGEGFVAGRAVALIKARPWRHLGAVLLGYTSYVLILWSYSMGGDVAAVTTVRQASIPLSVLLGGMVLKEMHTGRRLLASLVMVAGIVIVINAG